MRNRLPGEPDPDSREAFDSFGLDDFLSKAFKSNPNRDQIAGEGLIHCAYNNDLATAEQLIRTFGAEVSFADPRNGLTALHIAVGRDHLAMARYLVERGAKFLPDHQGRTPTTVAAECEVSDAMCDFIAEAEAKAEGV
jgi:ankyrin repeat protein